MAWSKPYAVNTGAGGDTRYNGFVKTGSNIDNIYVNLNLLKTTFIGTTAPSSPDSGQLWLDSNDDPPTLKQYHDSAWVAVSGSAPANEGFISGLAVSNATDTEHDISIAAGSCRDATNTDDMVNSAAKVKQADAAWAVGTNAGGMAAGESLPTSGTIHLWFIKRLDTGATDFMFNNHATTGLSPTLPEDYDYKRRIASFRTDGSANIINGDQWGTGHIRTWLYDVPILDVNANNPGADPVTAALSVPAGIIVKALMNVGGSGTTGTAIWISSLAQTASAPSASAAPLSTANNAGGVVGETAILTNTSSQIRYEFTASDANVTALIATLGWEDSI